MIEQTEFPFQAAKSNANQQLYSALLAIIVILLISAAILSQKEKHALKNPTKAYP
jgi:hypothetical protein